VAENGCIPILLANVLDRKSLCNSPGDLATKTASQFKTRGKFREFVPICFAIIITGYSQAKIAEFSVSANREEKATGSGARPG
jgi:hypothetical protein